jgi:release factor glutamine methyltransferase
VLLERRLSGEPLAWVTGRIDFDGLTVTVFPGVYVPRWQTIELARRAVSRLKDGGTAVDVCTGSGALAMALQRGHPGARVFATDIDPRAVACARANGVDCSLGDLFSPLPDDIVGAVDVVVAVPPYVPTPDLALLPRDTLEFEDVQHYDGGPGGIEVLRRLIADSSVFVAAGGTLLLEVGGDQADLLEGDLRRAGFTDIDCWADDDGDLRGIEANWSGSRARARSRSRSGGSKG